MAASDKTIDVLHTDEFDNLMRAYNAATAVFEMMANMEGIVIEDTHVALFHRMFNNMFDAKDEFTEMIENAKAEEK